MSIYCTGQGNEQEGARREAIMPRTKLDNITKEEILNQHEKGGKEID